MINYDFLHQFFAGVAFSVYRLTVCQFSFVS